MSQPRPFAFFPYVERFEPASDLGSGRRPCRYIDVSGDDDGTFDVEAGRDGMTNATRRAGDDARLVLKSLHDVLETRVQAADCSADVCLPALAVTLDHFENPPRTRTSYGIDPVAAIPINDF